MGSTRFPLLIIVCLVSLSASPLTDAQNMNMELKLATAEKIFEWSKAAFFGGFKHQRFTRKQSELIVVTGMPTSGFLTSQLWVFGRSKDTDQFHLLLVTKTIYADVELKDEPRGIVAIASKKELLVISFDLVNDGDAIAPVSSRANQ
jgi:hypothetical protein